VVGREIEKMLRKLIEEEYIGKIKEFVSARMSDEFVKNILDKMWVAYLQS
ncbi:hypothetical protein LCGC14_2256140, partial [marine sediment metagenome]